MGLRKSRESGGIEGSGYFLSSILQYAIVEIVIYRKKIVSFRVAQFYRARSTLFNTKSRVIDFPSRM